jgi:phosphoribosylglycinamide formyltransferase-1
VGGAGRAGIVVTTLALGVLVSGNGTNLQAILDAITAERLGGEVRLVLSSKPGVPALERARAAGVPTIVLEGRNFPDREAFDRAAVEALRAHGVEWVVLAGYMRLVSPLFLDAFPLRVINVHPALLPAFPGLDAVGQALRHGVRVSGCTVHLVDAGMDTGPILAQAAVAVRPGDDEDRLAARIHAEEHHLLPAVLARISAEGLNVDTTALAPGERPRVRFGNGRDSLRDLSRPGGEWA